MHLRSWEC